MIIYVMHGRSVFMIHDRGKILFWDVFSILINRLSDCVAA